MKGECFLFIVLILNCISILYMYYSMDVFSPPFNSILILIFTTVVIDMSLLPGAILLLYLAIFDA